MKVAVAHTFCVISVRGAISVSSSEPAADGAPGLVVVADDAKRGGDWDGEEHAQAAPDPSPKQQRDGAGDGVEANATADERRRDEVRSDHVDRCENSRD